MSALRIGIVGDFDRGKHSHWATEAALFHAGARLGVTVEPHWVPTPSVASVDGARRLQQFDGIWGAPGSPYESMTGILGAIQYAREHDMVYLGTCAGFQYALIEFSRNVLGLVDADSAENGPRAENIVITMHADGTAAEMTRVSHREMGTRVSGGSPPGRRCLATHDQPCAGGSHARRSA